MRPWSNKQFALSYLWSTSLLAHSDEVIDSILQEYIIPATDIQAGNSDILMLAYNMHRLYKLMIAVHGPRKTLEEERSNILPFKRLKFAQWQRPVSLFPQCTYFFRQDVNGTPYALRITTTSPHSHTQPTHHL